MRLNRGTLLMLAGSLAVIVVALLLINNPATAPDDADEDEAAASPQPLFEERQAAQLTRIRVEALPAADEAAEDDETDAADETNETEEAATTAEPAGPQAVAVARDGDGWAIEEASVEIEGEVDTSAIDSLADTLATLRYSERFEVESADLATYGLDQPAYIVELTFSEAAASAEATAEATEESEAADAGEQTAEPVTRTLRLGDQNPAGTRYYALVDDDQATVYLLASADDLETLTGWVDEPPVIPPPTPTPRPQLDIPGLIFPNIAAANVERFEIIDNESGQTLLLERTALAPEATPEPEATAEPTPQPEMLYVIDSETGEPLANTDSEQANFLVTMFGNIRAADGLERVDLATLGLDEPRYTFRVTETNSDETVLHIGGTDPSDTRYYAQAEGFDTLPVLERDSVDALLRFLTDPPLLDPAEATPEATAEDDS